MPLRSTSAPDAPSASAAVSLNQSAAEQRTRPHPTSAELYAAVSELTLRANVGEAGEVLAEIDDILASARAIGARRIVNQGLYVVAFCNLWLERLNDCERACDLLTAELSDDPIDRGWRSSNASLRAFVSLGRDQRVQAVEHVVDAAIQLRDAPPRGPGYLIAVNGMGVVCLALRLYELALAQYALVERDPVLAEHRVSALFASLNTQLAHIYWGLELDRVGSTATARRHFELALDHGQRAHHHLPKHDTDRWRLILETRSGLCLAFLGETDLAIPRLEAAIGSLPDSAMEETIMAHIGLARAAPTLDRETARLHAEEAMSAVGHLTDYALSMAASWERARLDLEGPTASAAADYCYLVAREGWEERVQLAGSVSSRVAVEVDIRRARQSDLLLYDDATGLPNRLLLLQQLAISVAAGGVVSLAFLEFADGGSDRALQAVIATLNVEFLATCEFGQLAAVSVEAGADELADRIRTCNAEALRHLTVGVAALAPPSSVTALVAHADEALLAARRRGGIWINPHACAR